MGRCSLSLWLIDRLVGSGFIILLLFVDGEHTGFGNHEGEGYSVAG